ncbi:MAG: PIG-L deacetylase family protein [Candidatus Dojkabacteria bacterium]
MLVKKNFLSLDLKQFEGKRVASIFPHPDDETMSAGGLLSSLAQLKETDVKILSLTHGEKGDELLKLPERTLAKLRAGELRDAAEILGVDPSNVCLWDYPDGKLDEHQTQLEREIKQYIKDEAIDYVITYERSGLYGHIDHVVASRVIANLAGHSGEGATQTEGEFTPIYTTAPDSITKRMDLPLHISALGENIVQAEPEFHLDLALASGLLRKYLAARAHKSQNLSRGRRFWYWPFFAGREYFTTKY